ncbi:hypothetical protein PO909_012948 [Leuciscus waleckii]
MGSRRGQKLFSPAAALEELLRSSDEENGEYSEESFVSSVDSEEEDMFLEGFDPVLDRDETSDDERVPEASGQHAKRPCVAAKSSASRSSRGKSGRKRQPSTLCDETSDDERVPEASGQHAKRPCVAAKSSASRSSRGKSGRKRQPSTLCDETSDDERVPEASGQHAKRPCVAATSSAASTLCDETSDDERVPEASGQHANRPCVAATSSASRSSRGKSGRKRQPSTLWEAIESA